MKNTLDNINPANTKAKLPEVAPASPVAPKQLKTALSMYRDPTDTKYVLVEITYDLNDANVKELARDVREDIIDKFKMTVADTFFGEL